MKEDKDLWVITTKSNRHFFVKDFSFVQFEDWKEFGTHFAKFKVWYSLGDAGNDKYVGTLYLNIDTIVSIEKITDKNIDAIRELLSRK